MNRILFLSCLVFLQTVISAQEKVPYAFRMHEKSVSKHIRKYVTHDTLVETSQAYIRVHFSSELNKPYLLMIHGMGVDAQNNWNKQIKDLSRYYNLILPDLIYFGKSKSKKENYSVEFQAQQLHEMIQKLGIKSPVHVMGFSYGGITAAVYNELFPVKGNKLILMDAPVKFFSTAMADSMALLVGAKSMTNVLVPETPEDYAALEKAVISQKIPVSKKMKRKFIKHYFDSTQSIRKEQLYYLHNHQKDYQNYTYNLATTTTLLIWGAKDGVVPVSVGEAIHAAYPNTTKLVVFKKAKHDVHFRYAKKLNKTVLEFLAN
jgi:pimeloyl-ACP methyl ester carboxylesterase